MTFDEVMKEQAFPEGQTFTAGELAAMSQVTWHFNSYEMVIFGQHDGIKFRAVNSDAALAWCKKNYELDDDCDWILFHVVTEYVHVSGSRRQPAGKLGLSAK